MKASFKVLSLLLICILNFSQIAFAQTFSLSPAQGPLMDCPLYKNRHCPEDWWGSGMQHAQLVKSGLTAGMKIRIGTVTGTAHWGGASGLTSPSPCKEGASATENAKPKLLVVFQFANEKEDVIDPGFATPQNRSAFTALDFDGKYVTVPAGATRLYASFPDSRYNDNSGTCVGSVSMENVVACNDGVDNDGDGTIDFPEDKGCSSANDNSEKTGKQCDNGQDDDGDGKIDALITINPNNNKQYVVSAGNPFTVRDFQAGKAVQYGLVPATEDAAILLDSATGRKICNMAGYAEVLAMACESPTYNGRCGYSTPKNNRMLRWNQSINNFEFIPAKGNNNWIASLSCIQKIAECRNGLDDDRDGKVDLADSGCANEDDSSESITHDPDCSGPEDDNENPETQFVCNDGKDNDGDGKIDFPADPGCSSSQDNDERNPNGPQCDNGRDDDGDGKVDFPADPGCTGPSDEDEKDPTDLLPPVCQAVNVGFTDGKVVFEWTNVAEADSYELGVWNNSGVRVVTQVVTGQLSGDLRRHTLPTNLALEVGVYSYRVKSKKGTTQTVWCNAQAVPFNVRRCQDSIDNDGDGKNNFPADLGCTDLRDNNERTGLQCDDGIDNDNDGKVDFPADPDCTSINDDKEEPDNKPACDDGKDNDGDGKIDFPADPGCSSKQDDSERNPNGPECDNGKDDDGDGKKDFPADPDCTGPEDDKEEPDTKPACDDGKDNDGDGKIDFPADPDCTGPEDDKEEPDTKPACDDGKDNDGDGKIDFPADPGCSSKQDDSERNPNGPECDNGKDDDGDGKVDFPADPDCTGPEDDDEGQDSLSFKVEKISDLDTVKPGQVITYTLTVKNAGTNIANQIRLVDQTPANLTYMPNGSTDGCVLNPANRVDCRLETYQAGQTRTYILKFKVNHDATCPSVVDNFADLQVRNPNGTYTSFLWSNHDYTDLVCKTQCSDAIDNDSDGLIDFPADPGCSSADDDSEKNPHGPQCDNGKDDDGDGKIDFPADPGCSSPTDDDEKDGISNLNQPVCKEVNVSFTDGRPVLEWTNVVNAINYEVQVWNANTMIFERLNVNGQLQGDIRRYRIPTSASLVAGNAYAFRVRAKNGTVLSDWCKDESGEVEPVPFAVMQCQDNQDNDGDTLNNFPADPGCTGLTDASERTGKQCDDGIDNDKDGKVDLADPDCKDINDDDENPSKACSDGIDNDNDGKIDFPADPGCSSPDDDSERTGKQCDDGVDNDGDGKIDFPADPQCKDINDDKEASDKQCSDGLDNDNDGKIDFPADLGCSSADDDDERKGTQCDDGKDNDGDGKIDFPADPDCKNIDDDNESPDKACSDGKDNDGDGKIDFPADPGCSSPDDDSERTGKQCDDGQDNDGDGKIDFPADPDCTDINDDSEAGATQCSDGKDNDGDGKIDFPADPDCTGPNDNDESTPGVCTPGDVDTKSCQTGLIGVCSAGTQTRICGANGQWGSFGSCQQTTQSGSEVCDDGLDNDCDGKTDSNDESCVQCQEIDNTDNIRTLDASAKSMAVRIRAIARLSIEQTTNKAYKSEGRKIRNEADNAAARAWQAAWQLPIKSKNCGNSLACQSQSIEDLKAEYNATIGDMNKLRNQANSLAKKVKLSNNAKKAQAKKNLEYERILNSNVAAIATIPNQTDVCN
jgi:uncharacterized repeat protein (TIGR01451 family)